MEMNLINPNALYDTIAVNSRSRQQEYFDYQFNLTNYRHFMAQLPPAPATVSTPEGDVTPADPNAAVRAQFQKLIDDTQAQMAVVDGIYTALQAQIVDEAAYAAAVARLPAA